MKQSGPSASIPKVKMYCIFARESIAKMKGSRGKLASMAGHAYLHAYWNASDLYEHKLPNKYQQAVAYRQSDHAYKITLVVDTVDELIELQEKYQNVCGTSLVTDAGFTVFDKPTTTCLGLGPIFEENIGDDLKALKVLM